jgi:hypothetical protein
LPEFLFFLASSEGHENLIYWVGIGAFQRSKLGVTKISRKRFLPYTEIDNKTNHGRNPEKSIEILWFKGIHLTAIVKCRGMNGDGLERW